ncbi:MAG: SusC/RagA family TonB-linked outer membrane protein, partial [Daejeonella sp.]
MKKNYLIKLKLLCFFLIAFYTASAQTGSISGRVMDETNQPLPGASVIIPGTDKSTSTDANGNFKITGLNPGSVTLNVRFLGYQPLEKTVTITSGDVSVDFQIQPNSENLTEVVVVGYGTQRKSEVTGAITTVSSKDFVKGQVTSPEQLIIGKVAGVQITSNSGAPGSGSTIRIRGGASLNASNDPLIVIDGNPFSGNTIGNVANPLSLINPNDIETFTVLKDANATAIYGSRASNGVIIITTKKGGSGAPFLSFNTMNSYSTIAKNVSVLSADQIRAYVNANGTTAQKALLGTANTSWQDEIYQGAFSTDNNFSIAGSFESVPYRVSIGYLDQKGLVITDALTRSTGALTISPKLFTNHLKIDLHLNGSLSNSHFANSGAIGAAIQFDPTQPVNATNAFGNYFEWISGGVPNPNAPRNPVALIKLQDNNGKADRSFGNIHLDYSFHFLPELHANINLAYDVSKGRGSIRVPDFAAQSASTKGSITQSLGKQKNLISEAYLNYAKDISSSNINITAGYGYYDNSSTDYNFASRKASGEIINTPVFPYSIERNKLLSYYGRLVYTIANKYIFSGTMRADGSSKFSEDNRWGYFPSAGFTWRASSESFLKDSKVLSDLKLRLSYGVTGNKDGTGIG